MMKSMDKFEESVNNMEKVVLMPSALRDRTADEGMTEYGVSKLGLPPTMAKSDLYSLYVMVKDLKEEMIKAIADKPKTETKENTRLVTSASSSSLSSYSDYLSDSDSFSDFTDESQSQGAQDIDIAIDCDTYVEPQLATNFTFHLAGLRNCLSRLSSTADFVTEASRKNFE